MAVAAGVAVTAIIAMVPVKAFASSVMRAEVNNTADAPDASPGDGQCKADDGSCTLRAAVMEANVKPGSTIVIPEGRYALTIPPRLGRAFTDYTLLDTAAGNLKIFAPTTIVGAGPDRTVIDGNHLDRVFTVLRPATISGLTITGGTSAPTASLYNYYGGGAALNASELRMERVRLTGNTARFGGAVQNIPFTSFTLRDSLVDGNEAGEAGGIRFDWNGLVERSTITRNRVVNPYDPMRPAELAGYGGGIDVRGPRTVSVVDSEVTDNYAEDGGGGINITFGYVPGPQVQAGPGKIELRGSVVMGNNSENGPSECRAVLARFVDQGGNSFSDGSCG
jgi:CSLREA domain-containing protein